MILSFISVDIILPFLSISIMQEIAKRSTSGFREQIPFDNLCGNIGITLSAKYTEVPLK